MVEVGRELLRSASPALLPYSYSRLPRPKSIRFWKAPQTQTSQLLWATGSRGWPPSLLVGYFYRSWLLHFLNCRRIHTASAGPCSQPQHDPTAHWSQPLSGKRGKRYIPLYTVPTASGLKEIKLQAVYLQVLQSCAHILTRQSRMPGAPKIPQWRQDQWEGRKLHVYRSVYWK